MPKWYRFCMFGGMGPQKPGCTVFQGLLLHPKCMESSQISFQGILAWCASFGTSAKSLRESALNTLTGRGHMVVASEKTNGHNSVVCKAIHLKFSLLLGL